MHYNIQHDTIHLFGINTVQTPLKERKTLKRNGAILRPLGPFDGRRRSEQSGTWRWDHVRASVMTLYSVSSPLDAEGKEMGPLLRGGELQAGEQPA